MASSRALAHVLGLVALAAGELEPFYLKIAAYSDSGCAVPSTENPAQVYDINNLGIGSPFDGLQALSTGCVPGDGGVYLHIQDCMINVYMDSECKGNTVAVQPVGPDVLGGCTFEGDEYYETTCVTEVPPADEAKDLTCWEQLATEELLATMPACAAPCVDQGEPTSCEAGLSMFGQCAVGCSEDDMRMLMVQLQWLFGCGCQMDDHMPGGDNGTSMYTCGDIKDAYKRNGCCGNPHKHFEMDDDHDDMRRRLTKLPRRLTKRSTPWTHGSPPKASTPRGLPNHDDMHRRLAKLPRRLTKRSTPWTHGSPPKVSTPRGLPKLNKKDVRDAAFVHSITRELARAKSSGGARRAQNMAAEIEAVLRPYLSQGKVQV